jgi:hypothetical protein
MIFLYPYHSPFLEFQKLSFTDVGAQYLYHIPPPKMFWHIFCIHNATGTKPKPGLILPSYDCLKEEMTFLFV